MPRQESPSGRIRRLSLWINYSLANSGINAGKGGRRRLQGRPKPGRRRKAPRRGRQGCLPRLTARGEGLELILKS